MPPSFAATKCVTTAGDVGAPVWRLVPLVLSLMLTMIAGRQALGATGYDAAWLRYSRIDDKNVKDLYTSMPAVVVALGDSAAVRSAQGEFILGVRGMLGRTLRAEAKLPEENAIVLGTYDVVSQAVPAVGKMSELPDDGYWLRSVDVNGTKYLIVTGPNDRGVLYGAFALLQKIALSQPIAELNEQQSPLIPLRLVGHPDRLDGTVNPGYGGPSIFWEKGRFTATPDRVRDYARLLASIGINAAALNDASEGKTLLKEGGVAELAKAADMLRPWGLRTFVAINASDLRESIGASANGSVEGSAGEALAKRVEDIYKAVPDLGGIVLSQELPALAEDTARGGEAPTEAPDDGAEASVGASPSRSHENEVDLINAAAHALAPHAGVLIYRPLVPRAGEDEGQQLDPAMALSASLEGLDGQLGENVILDIPARPASAHVRQPPPPVFGEMTTTGTAIEFDLTQELLGQQRHLCFLVPVWKATLDFDLKVADQPTPVKALVAAKPQAAFIAMANVGRDLNWLRDPLAMANLFGFGRLAWNPDLASKAIAEEWARLTFGHDPLVVGTVVELLLDSSQIYENYTGPLGLGTLAGIARTGYGPDVEGTAESGYRLRADDAGVGVDRTIESGSGFLARYRPEVARLFESLETCPPDVILFLHHAPYTHRLKSGKTLIQQIYNSLYSGAEGATRMAEKWRTLEGKIDEGRYRNIRKRLNYQVGHAQAWRDALANWFLRKSGIADDEGRVGNYPNRFEAESMQLEGYEAKNVTPWETASGGQCAESVAPTGKGAMSFKYEGEPGWVDLSIRYFDENDGASQFELVVAGEVVDQWKADDTLPDKEPNGTTTTRHVTRSIALRKGDEIRLQASADGGERAAVDYIEIRSVKP